ncbi:hypothetical protein JCM10908_001297 [Rhodotorula pacifica]|uniref:phosphatidylinositol-3-phosphate binding protein n=1 Tax=Rhodotorula pacifica TaxID=1495444 RepID=UPI003179743D
MAAPGYATYTPKRQSSSVSSIHHFTQGHATPPPRASDPASPSPVRVQQQPSRPSSGSARPASIAGEPSAFHLQAPLPSRPKLPFQFSGLSARSTGVIESTSPPSTGVHAPHRNGIRHSDSAQSIATTASMPALHPSLSRSPPPSRATPPPSAFPFASVPPGQSPFPANSPAPYFRARSPEKGPVAQVLQQSGAQPRRGKLPYQAGFQPQGVKRDRSDDFFEQRRKCGEARKLDEGRLARRLEKLVALHFPPETPHTREAPEKTSTSPFAGVTRLGETIRSRSAKDLWRSAVAQVDTDIERAEQSIVKWQPDKEATHCAICSAAFGVRVRRHHCRLCGRVVCFLPPTPIIAIDVEASPATTPYGETPPQPKATRRERCSTFFTYEQQMLSDGKGEKQPFGVVVEIPPVEQDLSIDAVLGAPSTEKKPKDERKKVRVCRDCLNTTIRQQLKTLPVRTPTWLKLYEVLVELEKEIDETLPEFQELAVMLSNPAAAAQSTAPPSANHAKSLRKRLLADLASYDTVSKRIRDLPLPEGGLPNGSQDRLQRALAARGQLFLSEKLGLLRSLGNMEELGGGGGGGAGGGAGKASKAKLNRGQSEEYTVKSLADLLEKEDVAKVREKVGPELEAAAKLNVLREQEALVQSYVEDANARRQFEDAAALQTSLDELRAEISAISATLP